MERRSLARSGARGGEDIQAARQARTRLATGFGAVAVATALAALPLARGGDVFAVGLRVAIAALLALVAALVLDQPSLVTASLLLLGALYGAQLALEDAPLDAAAALVAAGIVVTAELAYWSLEERDDVKGEAGDSLRRLAFVALLGLGAAVVAAMLLVLVAVVRARGLAVDVLGAVAAAAVLLAVVLAAGGRARARP